MEGRNRLLSRLCAQFKFELKNFEPTVSVLCNSPLGLNRPLGIYLAAQFIISYSLTFFLEAWYFRSIVFLALIVYRIHTSEYRNLKSALLATLRNNGISYVLLMITSKALRVQSSQHDSSEKRLKQNSIPATPSQRSPLLSPRYASAMASRGHRNIRHGRYNRALATIHQKAGVPSPSPSEIAKAIP
ncbi:hypothetical protein CC1G_10015 [Coprinopsis cinerea okayama7|uniref:Uncharacterized protein n=1 Tax=Coprinopsis cinerea (strain Okayama-7 / 130 / ATCC MYA-4618 / FGSC 9003) TaxID=240176 RepID=A8NDL4_COPC7|nr:hypothetical protein CC1G_10015 [Coprinopsis cinerea okayama7\|eukprot:XP_001832801.2 hypothetical protein CC1G_10015 [Coprinopsis cinerea okayama7\